MDGPDGTDYVGRRWLWRHWYESSFLLQLQRTLRHFADLGTTPRSLLKDITNRAPRPWTEQVAKKAKKTTQKQAYQTLLEPLREGFLDRLQHKISRWNLPGHPPWVASRILQRVRALRTLVPPRVQAAVFSTQWNRWTTARRFQVHGAPCLY